MPDRERFGDHRTFLQKFGKQILMSICASLIAGCILNATGILKAVRYASSVVIHTTGDPLGDKPVIRLPHDFPHGPISIPNLPKGSPIHKSPEQIEAEENVRKAREAEKARAEKAKLEERRESDRKSIMAKLEAMGWPFDPQGSLEKLQVELEQAKEMEHKKPLFHRADKAGIKVNPKDPYDLIEDQVKEAELDADYQRQLRDIEEIRKIREQALKFGPNARCLNPKCHYQWRTNLKHGQIFCPRCRAIWYVPSVKANMPPPPPIPMAVRRQKKDSLFDKAKGLIGK